MKQRIVKLNKKIDDHGLLRVLNIYELSAIDCSASAVSGILFFATESNGGTSNYPRLFGSIDSIQTTVVTQE